MSLIGRTLRRAFETLLSATSERHRAAMADALRRHCACRNSSQQLCREDGLLDYEGAAIEMEHGLRTNSCAREPFTVEWIDRYVSRGEVFYDIGANVGAYAMIAAHRVGARGRVYAFEPAFYNFPILVKNLRRNDLLDRVIPVNFPLAGTSGLSEFNHSTLREGSALHALGEPLDHAGMPFQPVLSQPMLSASLDDFVLRHGFPLPTHVKLDVDGIEMEILRGGRQVFTETTNGTLLVEDAGRFSQEELYDFARECGYSLIRRYRYPGVRIKAWYHLFGKGSFHG